MARATETCWRRPSDPGLHSVRGGRHRRGRSRLRRSRQRPRLLASYAAGGPLSARFGHSALAIDGRLFIWGEQPDDGDPVADSAFYDPEVDSWTPIAAASDGRVFHASAFVNASVLI